MNGVLLEWRAKTGTTQAKFAEAIGVDQTTVSKWELGKSKIPITRVPQISKITGIPRIELRPDLPDLFA